MSLSPAARVGERKGLATGLVLTITMIAFEALGVATAMPVVAEELDGLRLYGWAFTAPILASLIGISIAGRAVDRLGPGRPFAAGLVLFGIGLTIAGAAPTMLILVGGRVVQGLGIGVIPPVAYAAIGRAFADRARARMFALLSTAWVMPGLIGPAISGTVAEEVGWRWVFLAILPLVPLNALLTLPALVRMGPPAGGDAHPGASDHTSPRAASIGRGPVGRAIALAGGTALIVAGLGWLSPLAVLPVVIGIAVVAPPLRSLLPDGTFRAAEGLPAAIAARGLQTFAFFGAQTFLTLALTNLRGLRAGVAGLALTGATLSWTVGAWVQDRRGHTWGRRTMVVRGLGVLVLGTAVTMLLLWDAVPVAVGAVGWTIAGLGMGMSYSGLSLIVLAEAPAGREGSATSALQLSDVFGMAVGTGLGGAAVALGDAAGTSPLRGIAAAFGLALAAAMAGRFAATRLHEVVEDEPGSAVPAAEGSEALPKFG